MLPFRMTDKSTTKTVYSRPGRDELLSLLDKLSNSVVYLITMQPYSFVAAKEEEQYFIIDVISSELGGNGNGILKLFKQSSAVARWIWKRISNSGVKPSEIQEIVAIQWNDDFPSKEKFEPDGLKSGQNQPQTREPMTVDEEDKKQK